MSVDAPPVNPDGGSGPDGSPAEPGQPLLSATGISKEFGGLVAVNDVSFDIPPGTIVSIIGPNGAGKTTFFNMLTGLYKPTRGRISFDGRDITRARPDKITGRGVARTFQNIRLFGAMTALENVMVGQHVRMKTGLLGAIGRPPWVRREERDVRKSAADMLAYVGLASSHFENLAINLSYGDQRRVEIARALASNPKLLLLDEPTAGMNPQESARLTAVHAHDAQGPVADHPPDRARHESDHGRLRAHHRARPRREDRRGSARRGPRQPARDRGVSGGPDMSRRFVCPGALA